MSASAARPAGTGLVPAIIVVAACAGLAVGAVFDPSGAAGGFVFAFLFWLGIPVGSMVLLEIYRLTSGAWGHSLYGTLRAFASTMPLFLVLFVVVLIAAPLLFPWAADPAAWSASSRWYMTSLGFVVRGLATLAIWIAIVFAPRPPGDPRLWAGIALTLYGLTLSVVAPDWSMSLTAKWSSSTYAAMTGVGQITAALTLAALTRMRKPADGGTSDVAALIIAGILGFVYIAFMQYLVTWAGNLPDKAAYYVDRSHNGWKAIEFVALIVGGAVPFVLLLRRRARADPRVVGIAGALVLIGLLIDWLWQTAPAVPGSHVWAFILAPIGVGGLFAGLASRTGTVVAAARREVRGDV